VDPGNRAAVLAWLAESGAGNVAAGVRGGGGPPGGERPSAPENLTNRPRDGSIMRMNGVDVLPRVDGLLTKGAAIQALPREQQPYGGGGTWVEDQAFREWRAQSLAFLRATLPDNHTYVQEFIAVTDVPLDSRHPEDTHVQSGRGVLLAVRDDLEHGHLAGLRALVSAEIFTEFIEMAEHLESEGYYHAAASVAGAVLEDALRRTLVERGQRATGNLESMNQVAFDTGTYGRAVFLQVKVWIAVRNEADHGNWEVVDREAVKSMIQSIPTFMVQQLGLS
jgi:hypothetical protein